VAADRPGKPGRTAGAGLRALTYNERVVVDVVASVVLILMLADLARMLFVDED
jgi:hypothetical protein